MLGTTVAGRYEIEAQIGVGGMGIVYRAHDTRLRRDVALKMIAPHLMQQESARVRFLREAQALAGLMHPNIVTIFDMAEDEDSNTVFLVMELLSGHSLRQFLSDGICPRTPGCPLFSQIALPLCRALEAAHKRGVLHRDIKPENIFVCDDGELKLMDFGLARLLGDMSKNQSSTVAGTLAYMAPEQLRGDKLDARTDLYALGAVFFEFVTGTQPFLGDNPGTVLLKHLTEPPPSLRDRLPVPVDALAQETLNALDALLMRMMAKEPAARPASAAEIRNLLEQALPHGEILVNGVNHLLTASAPSVGIATHAITQSMPIAPVSIPTAEIAALLTPRQTGEADPTADISPSVKTQTTPMAAETLTRNAPSVSLVDVSPTIAQDTESTADAKDRRVPPATAAPAWKRYGAVVGGISVLGLVSVLAAAQFWPHAPSVSNTPASTAFPAKQRQGDAPMLPAPSASSGSTPAPVALSTPVPATPPALVSKSDKGSPKGGSSASIVPQSGNNAPDSTRTPTKTNASTPASGTQSSVNANSASSGKNITAAPHVSGGNVRSTAADAEREAWRKQQQEELALIRTLKQELDAARALNTASNAKANGQSAVSNAAKKSAIPVKLPQLPNVSDESKPSLVIGMNVRRVKRDDPKVVHINLQNDVDCYAYFYLLPPRKREAVRLFAGYEYFAAAPKNPYAINLLLPQTLPDSRGAILIVASKKEMKNLPATFELSLPPPPDSPPTLTGEQRQQIGRQYIHQFSDHIADQLAGSHTLLGGQLLQAHDVVARLVGLNPMAFGRNPDGSRRNPDRNRRQPGQSPFQGRRSFQSLGESGTTGAAH